MHSIEEMGTNVPAFLAKLWKIVEDAETNDLICWSPNGQSFYIRNQARFARELLPLYYKHNNMASFVRQLNMYGFHKVVSIDGGGLKVDKDEMEFAHQYFLMGHPYLLEHIKRKIPTTKVEEARSGGTTKPELMNKVLSDVKTMKGRQDSLDTQLSAMKRENEVLWREVAILRQKHLKQQQIVNKLIQFLVSMVQTSRSGGIGIKRHYPLMLNDTSHRPSKVSKLGAELSDLNNAPSSMSPTGPVIHEIDTAELFEECEPNPEETSAEGDFLTTDLCNVINTEKEHESASSSSNQIRSGTPDLTTSNPSPEVLLELAEECPLSPSMLLTASPMEVNPVIVAPRLSKGKLRTRVGSSENRKRKSKNVSTNSKAENASAVSAVPVNHEDVDPLALESEEMVNGVDLLDVVLPTLVTGKAANIHQKESSTETTKAQSNEAVMASDPLAAATSAAISAISNVAAASRNKPSKSISLSSGKNVSKTGVNGVLPVKNDFRQTSISSKTNMKLTPSNVMVFKQEPSTSCDKEMSSSNMVLACTGNNSGESFKRCGIPDELDGHVDNMQNELESLRDLLKGDGYSLDANTLLGVCAAIPGFEQDFIKLFDDPMSELPAEFENFAEEQDKESITGTELTTYSSNLLDMVDLCDGPETGVWSGPTTPDASNIMDVSLSELNTPQITLMRPNFPKKTK